MKQEFGKYTLEVTATDKEGSSNEEAISLWSMCVAVKILASRAKITEEDILRKLAEHSVSSLTKDEIISGAKEILAKLCESGSLTVDENGYYS